MMENNLKNEENYFQVASKGRRLGAVIVDMIIVGIINIQLLKALGYIKWPKEHIVINTEYVIVSGFTSFLIFLLINIYFLNLNGQTLGKKIFKIKIVSKSYEPAKLSSIIFLRYLPLWIAGYIPYLKLIIGFVDPLLIFRKSQYCLHDDIAKTTVIMSQVQNS